MKKTKSYPHVAFTSSAVRRIQDEALKLIGEKKPWDYTYLYIRRGRDQWNYDNLEEYFAELREGFDTAVFKAHLKEPEIELEIELGSPHNEYPPTVIGIRAPTRADILQIANIAEECAKECFVQPPPETPRPPKPKPVIFIGHGGSALWRDLKDHLHDHHGYTIEAYETGSRAGHTIRDVLGQMLLKSSFGLLVMTAEDRQDDGSMRARQNVIHEIGLFQGRLGFSKAIVLKEEGTEEFSNLHGVQQIRFSKGNIKETFGDILAVLKREFED